MTEEEKGNKGRKIDNAGGRSEDGGEITEGTSNEVEESELKEGKINTRTLEETRKESREGARDQVGEREEGGWGEGGGYNVYFKESKERRGSRY